METKELMIVKQEPELCLPVQARSPEWDFNEFLRRRSKVAGEVIQNPDWLPSGWVTEIRTRKSGLSAGHTDKYYFQPGNGARFRSKVEVMRYLETGSKERPKSISDAFAKSDNAANSFIAGISNSQAKSDHTPIAGISNAQAKSNYVASSFGAGISNAHSRSDLPACGCSEPVYYYRPVVCESPLYAEHPGLYPVIYFPVIGNSEDRFKHPPAKFLQNLGDLKPIFSQPSNASSQPSSKYDLFRDAFAPRKRYSYKVNARQKFSGNVAGDPAMKKNKPILVCGSAAPNAEDFNTSSSSHQVPQPHQNSNPVSNPIAPNSVALSCNISSFTVTTPAGVFSAHLQYRPSTVMEQQHYNSPITFHNQNQPIPARAMRGQLSPEELSTYNQGQNLSTPSTLSTCTALVPWKA